MFEKRKIIAFFCMIMFVISITTLPVHAESKQVEIVSLNETGDLTVMFTFDKENVDISFISPSGQVITSDSSDVEFEKGDLWSTYRIKDAAKGTWKVEYDLKSNSEISYSIIEDEYGLWIQYINVMNADNDLEVVFKTDYDESDIYYSYEIYAVSTADANNIIKLTGGSAKANNEEKVKVNLKQLSSDEYVIRLDAFYDDGGVELFDTVLSEAIKYDNPNAPSEIEDFKVKIDMDEHICSVDWSDYTGWGCNGYKLIVIADGEAIYNSEMENNTQSNSVLFSEGTKNIEIKLAYKTGDLWSTYKNKTINLENEFLRNITGNITNSSQIDLQYKTIKERLLNVIINEEEGKYKVKEEGTLSFDLKEEINDVHAELEIEDNVYFIVEGSVYLDTTPPTIKLYDDLDGKTFYSDKTRILGEISGGEILKINDALIEVGEDGSFSYDVELSLGENVIEIICEDSNGNEADRILTLYRGASIFNAEENNQGWMSYLPLIASALTSVLLIILAFVFMKKKEKSSENRIKVYPFVVWDVVVVLVDGVCWWQFVSRYIFSNSIKYLELAEKSASQAAQYIKWERIFGIIALAALVIFIFSVILTIFISKKTKKSKEVE